MVTLLRPEAKHIFVKEFCCPSTLSVALALDLYNFDLKQNIPVKFHRTAGSHLGYPIKYYNPQLTDCSNLC